MTTIEISLPDELANRARDAGLLSETAIRALLEDAMRRGSGQRLLDVVERVHTAGISPMSMDEVDAEVKAYRAERSATRGAGR